MVFVAGPTARTGQIALADARSSRATDASGRSVPERAG
jgi:hypothetical protein